MDVKQSIEELRKSRGWDKTDTSERLAQFLIIEASELLECFLQEEVDYQAVQEELADVLMYAFSLCYDNNWDYNKLINDKIVKVKEKYPVHE